MELESIIEDEVRHYTGPILIYDTSRIRANLDEFIEAMGHNPAGILFAVKSFPALPIISKAWEAGLGFEVSNEREYRLLPKNLSGRTVSLNNPLCENTDRFLEFGNLLQAQVDMPPGLKSGVPPTGCGFSLRLSHKSLPIDPSLILEPDRPSRFGVSWESFLSSAPLYRKGVLSGVHLHNGSEQNTPAFYRGALEVILDVVRKDQIPLQYVNLGGGFHPIPQPQLMYLLSELRKSAGELPIFIEPGHVLCRNAGFLLCKVHEVRPFGGERYHITLDASYDCHAKWSYPSWTGPVSCEITKMPYQKIPEPEPGYKFLIFTGATCYERDQLGIFRVTENGSALPVAPGDPVLLSNINGYSFAWNTGFNGVSKARVGFF